MEIQHEKIIDEPKKLSATISDLDLKKYRNKMEETQCDTICLGYRKISKLAGLTDSKGRQIFEYLKQVGIIETTNKGTRILKFQNGGNYDKKRA